MALLPVNGLRVRQERESAVGSRVMNIIRCFQESCKMHARYLKYKYKRIMHYKPRSSRNLGKILVRSPWPNLAWYITNDLPEPYDNLGKILVRSPWPNLVW